MELINKYFPNLSDVQKEQFKALDALYRDWNSKINVFCLIRQCAWPASADNLA